MSTSQQVRRQIKENQQQIQEKLKKIKPEDTTSVMKSHNSVNISYQQLLDYIDQASKSIPPGDIKTLLETYRSMVEMFYTQYERTLLVEIIEHKEIQEQTEQALQSIDGLPQNSSSRASLEQVTSLLVKDHEIAGIEYKKLIENYPMHLQNALNKLRDEWQRLNSVAVANQSLTEDPKLDRALKAVVEVAAHSVGVEAERIAIVPGSAFALKFFTYLDNLAVLTVPIYSVKLLWEWSIFWHELAGYKVRRLEKSATIAAVSQKITDFHNDYKRADSDPELQDRLLKSISWDNEFCQNYFKDIVFKDGGLDLKDLGGFEDQFERMVIDLTADDGLKAYDQIKSDGWSVDWFKELFEDAWSVVTIGEPFMDLFSDILARNAVKDARHPPIKVRLSVANEILKLLNPETTMENKPTPVEKFTAQRILNFVALLRAAARQYEKPNVNVATDLPLLRQHIRDNLFSKVRDGIKQSIENWSKNVLGTENRGSSVTNNAKKLLEMFADSNVENLLSQLHEYEAQEIKPSYEELLENRNYEQLLKLSFSETDYHTPGDIELLESGRTYWVKPVDWNSTIWLTQRHPAGHTILPTEITITEVSTHVDWRIRQSDWTGWFKMTQ